MIVYDTSLIRVRTAFEHLASPAGDLPTGVQVRQKLSDPTQLHITLTYPDRTEGLVLS